VSNALNTFAPQEWKNPEMGLIGQEHLHKKALFRQQVFERCVGDVIDRPKPVEVDYQSRDRPAVFNIRHCNVLEITSLVRTWPQNMSSTVNLGQKLTTNSSVGGFQEAFAKVALNDRLRVNILQAWGSLVRFAQECRNPYTLMYLLATIAFNLDADMELLRTILAFAVFDELRSLPLPVGGDFAHFHSEQSLHMGWLMSLLNNFQVPLPNTDLELLGEYSSAKQRRKWQDQQLVHKMQVERDQTFFAEFLLRQWPSPEPTVQGLEKSLLIDLEKALEAIRPEWSRFFHNMQLLDHIKAVQRVLDKHTSGDEYTPPAHIDSEDKFHVRLRGNEVLDLKQLLLKPVKGLSASSQNGTSSTREQMEARLTEVHGNVFQSNGGFKAKNPDQVQLPFIKDPIAKLQGAYVGQKPGNSSVRHPPISDLQAIIHQLGDSKSSVKQRYAADLDQSLSAFRKVNAQSLVNNSRKEKNANQILWATKIDTIFRSIVSSFDEPGTTSSAQRIYWLKAGNMWPVVNRETLLRALRSASSQSRFGSGMREKLIEMGVMITEYQRQIRLKELWFRKETARHTEELVNEGHQNWSPAEHPDWLLLEIESNMMIRPVQIDVARATIAPATGSNSVLQMNMGQGK
jgi:hypothetical protein